MEMIAGRLRRLRLVVRTPTRSKTQQAAQSILISNHLLSISDCCSIILHITFTFFLQIKVAITASWGASFICVVYVLDAPFPLL